MRAMSLPWVCNQWRWYKTDQISTEFWKDGRVSGAAEGRVVMDDNGSEEMLLVQLGCGWSKWVAMDWRGGRDDAEPTSAQNNLLPRRKADLKENYHSTHRNLHGCRNFGFCATRSLECMFLALESVFY
jgi:hypothetical protein